MLFQHDCLPGKMGLAVMTIGSVFLRLAVPAAPQPATGPAERPSLRELAVERYETANKGYEWAMAGHKPGEALGEEALEWLRLRARARLQVAESKADRVAFLEDYVRQLQLQNDFMDRLAKLRIEGPQSVLRVRYARLEGEMWLADAEERVGPEAQRFWR